MNDFATVTGALSDGSRRRIPIALRDEKRTHPFSGDGDERNRASQLHHDHLPLREENDLVAWNQDTGIVRRGDDLEAVEPTLTAPEARRAVLPDDHLSEEGQTC